jgi:hypothetical protein
MYESVFHPLSLSSPPYQLQYLHTYIQRPALHIMRTARRFVVSWPCLLWCFVRLALVLLLWSVGGARALGGGGQPGSDWLLRGWALTLLLPAQPTRANHRPPRGPAQGSAANPRARWPLLACSRGVGRAGVADLDAGPEIDYPKRLISCFTNAPTP